MTIPIFKKKLMYKYRFFSFLYTLQQDNSFEFNFSIFSNAMGQFS